MLEVRNLNNETLLKEIDVMFNLSCSVLVAQEEHSNSTYLRLFKSLSSGDAVSRNTIVICYKYLLHNFFQKILIYFRLYCNSDSVFVCSY